MSWLTKHNNVQVLLLTTYQRCHNYPYHLTCLKSYKRNKNLPKIAEKLSFQRNNLFKKFCALQMRNNIMNGIFVNLGLFT